MKYDPNRHHRRSIRLQGYDYSQEGLYFITICTHGRRHLFGEVINSEMLLNDAGKNAEECWLAIPKHFPDAVLHEHIVMPNHLHGIIELRPAKIESSVGVENLPVRVENLQSLPQPLPQTENLPVRVENLPVRVENLPVRVENLPVRVENLQPQQTGIPHDNLQHSKQNEFQQMIPRSIGSIVKGYKIGVTKWFRATDPGNFAPGVTVWQRNYYEHIIRDEPSYLRIADYIINNPQNWKEDKFWCP